MIGRGTPEGPRHGAIADPVFRDGPVTLARIARDGGALFGLTAQVRGRDPSGFAGCRGWLQDFSIGGEEASLEDAVATIMGHGLEHHFVLMPQHLAGVLAEFGTWTGMTLPGRIPMQDHLSAR